MHIFSESSHQLQEGTTQEATSKQRSWAVELEHTEAHNLCRRSWSLCSSGCFL